MVANGCLLLNQVYVFVCGFLNRQQFLQHGSSALQSQLFWFVFLNNSMVLVRIGYGL